MVVGIAGVQVIVGDRVFERVVGELFAGAELLRGLRLEGGVSADVQRLDLRLVDGRETSVVLRAHGASHSGHSAGLEYRLLQALYRQGVPVAEPLLVDESGRLIAEPFVVMAFVEGDSAVPAGQQERCVGLMADALASIHALPTGQLPELPPRVDPLLEVFDYLPSGSQWRELREHLGSLADIAYSDTPRLLHGDFWPANILWRDGAIAAILDWEDAALGDPLSDVAACRVELRYKFGKPAMQQFTQAYAKYRVVDSARLALWQVYVAAAAQHFMGEWGLPAEREARMRVEALASIEEAGATLLASNR